MKARRARLAFEGLGSLLVALYLLRCALRNVSLQWDLRAYLAAAHAALAGVNPYRVDLVSALAGRATQPFIYPPVALAPFVALAALPPTVAPWVWMFGKLAALSALVLVWRRWLSDRRALFALLLMVAFGWSGALLADLRAGNVALVECALLWAGFACFASGRRVAFAACVVAAACFKLAPAAFLLLLLVPDGRTRAASRWGLFAIAVATFAILVAGPYAFAPVRGWGSFLARVPAADTLGPSNPSALGLFIALARGAGLGAVAAGRAAWLGWALYAAGVIAAGAATFRRAAAGRDLRAWVIGAVFVFALLAPRPMAYGFLLLGPAPLFVRPRLLPMRAGDLVLALALAAQGLAAAASLGPGSLVVMYSPTLLALCCWLLVTRPALPAAPGASTADAVPTRLAA